MKKLAIFSLVLACMLSMTLWSLKARAQGPAYTTIYICCDGRLIRVCAPGGPSFCTRDYCTGFLELICNEI